MGQTDFTGELSLSCSWSNFPRSSLFNAASCYIGCWERSVKHFLYIYIYICICIYDRQHFTSLSRNSSIGGCKGFTKSFPDCSLLVCNQIKFRIVGEFSILYLVVCSPRRLGFTNLTRPSCPYQNLLSHFQETRQDFAATVAVLGIDALRT
jgi:hypothetical protein